MIAVANPLAAAGTVAPAGELSKRIALTARRLTLGGFPEFTRDFILADVQLDPGRPRRFSNFSGDLSGRYIGALAMLPPRAQTVPAVDLGALVSELLRFQRDDGRFGNSELRFTASDIGGEHMALLWGNGRLLVGLIEYCRVSKSDAALRAARRLGDFLLSVHRQCAAPEVIQRLEGQGANGFICFTQLIEGLVLLAGASGTSSYLDAAKQIVPLLQPRGIQHSHGYLSTLRGIVLLHEATGDRKFLTAAEEAWRGLVSSADYTIDGGVLEYFGAARPPGEDSRTEGCSEADFLRLSLQLWRATGDSKYLEAAERCLLNAFFSNQFSTGDFGHHVVSRAGFKPSDSVGRAWWCCTMHGYRAFRDVLDAIVAESPEGPRVHLFQDSTWSSGRWSLALGSGAGNSFHIRIQSAPADKSTVAIREPGWAAQTAVRLNGAPLPGELSDGYRLFRREWKAGDQIELQFAYKPRFHTRQGKILPPEEIGAEPLEAALFYGPRLLAVHEGAEPLFFGEPWPENVVFVPQRFAPGTHVKTEYQHGGFTQRAAVTLRPISERSLFEQEISAVWLRYRRST